MASYDEFMKKRLDRRRFLQLAGLATAAGTVASLSGGSADAADAPRAARPTTAAAPVTVRPDAQYGRARGRYPVAARP